MKVYYLYATVEGRDLKVKHFPSRAAAEHAMYKIMDRNNLQVINSDDMGHYRTYKCGEHSWFHINRAVLAK